MSAYRSGKKQLGALAKRQAQSPAQMLIRTALEHHRAGRLSNAEHIYRRILQANAGHADSLHLLGMICYQRGQYEEAASLIRKAIEVNEGQPSHHSSPSYHSNLGIVLHAQQKLDEAVVHCRRALALDPNLPETLNNLGCILQLQGKLDEATACYERALALKPDVAEVHGHLGNAMRSQGRLDRAATCYERALALKPEYAEAANNLGTVLEALDRLDEAAAQYRRALALHPGMAEAYNNLGNIYQAQGDLIAAAAEYGKALALRPEYAEAHSNLGIVFEFSGRPDEAVARHRHALALKPDFAEAHHNLGNALRDLGELDEAMACYERALALKPEYAEARLSHALAQLLAGDFAAGWRNYESRWQTQRSPSWAQSGELPLWNGEKLTSGRVLIWGEQGVGDEIMFAGLLPEAAHTGNHCVLACSPRLRPLFARSFPGIEVASGPGPELPPDIAAHLPCGSLPRLFRTSKDDFAAMASPYLVADPVRKQHFRERYGDGRLRVGLAWHTKNRKTGRRRSIDLSLLAHLFEIEGTRWVSLQYGQNEALAIEVAASGAPLLVDPAVDQLADMDAFAAQVAAMDLVITIDNSTAHLAGALGIPTWVLLPSAADWRWMRRREDSPWYPTMRLFRQNTFLDWQGVIERVGAGLSAFRRGV